MQISNVLQLASFIIIVSLIISAFTLQIGYTYDEVCPTCQGKGTVTCDVCLGSGVCPFCDGRGEIAGLRCAACQGTGICHKCKGKGWLNCGTCEGAGIVVHWIYNITGSTIIPSIISILLFLGLFVFSYMVSAFYLSFNKWIYDVEEMGFWFNPSFMTWLFAKHPKRWVKWQTGLNLIIAIYLGFLIFWILAREQIAQETLVTGTLLSITIVASFSLIFYKAYTLKLEESPMT